MNDLNLTEHGEASIPILPAALDALDAWPDPAVATWAKTLGYGGKRGQFCFLPGIGAMPGGVLMGQADPADLWDYAALAASLPGGTYRLPEDLSTQQATAACLGWAVGSYRFTRYKAPEGDPALLLWPADCDRARVEIVAGALNWTRDLINTPAQDMGPADLAEAALSMAEPRGGHCRVLIGEELLARGYPAVHAVGRAAAHEPHLIDIIWGHEDAPRVTLVGKGVCFDTGGLDIKTAAGMRLMKKDMGGAAHVLGLARMIMDTGLKLRLRVLVPAVENSISGNALHPLDIVPTRAGKTVEIGHTDAEGRVILADALAEASSENPEFLLDMATLTGAARVALGTELPALFCNDDDLAGAILAAGVAQSDPLWRLPLHQPYRRFIDSPVADLSNEPKTGFGGALTAALFLEEFVGDGIPWCHMDLMAWNPNGQPGRPEGADAQGLRALFEVLAAKYG